MPRLARSTSRMKVPNAAADSWPVSRPKALPVSAAVVAHSANDVSYRQVVGMIAVFWDETDVGCDLGDPQCLGKIRALASSFFALFSSSGRDEANRLLNGGNVGVALPLVRRKNCGDRKVLLFESLAPGFHNRGSENRLGMDAELAAGNSPAP